MGFTLIKYDSKILSRTIIIVKYFNKITVVRRLSNSKNWEEY